MSDSLHFGAPLFLGLAPIALLIGLALARHARASAPALAAAQIARRRVAHDTLRPAPELSGRLGLFGERARPWWLLGAALACVALARPQWGLIPEQRFQQTREVLLALDLSRSMTASDVAPNRLERAKLLILGLLPELAGERVGLVVFAGSAFLQSPLSADTEVLRDLLPELRPEFLPQGGTNYAQMLQTALEAFSTEGQSDRFLVVLSDGEAHDDRWREPLAALVARGVRVLGLGLGTAAGTVLEAPGGGVLKDARGAAVLSRLEPATLEELARESGGVYRDAALWVDLAELIRSTVARGRQGQFAETSEPRQIERFQWALLPAFACWFLALWLELPARARERALRPAPAVEVARAALAALALGGAAAALWAAPIRAAEVAAPAPSAPTSLSELVARLAVQPALAASDFAQLAETTLRALEPGIAAAPGAARAGTLEPALRRALVRDGTEAVGAGEQLDPAAADWKQLRERLAALAQEPPTPPPQGQPETPQAKESSPEGQQGSDGDSAMGEPAEQEAGERSAPQPQDGADGDSQSQPSEGGAGSESAEPPAQGSGSERESAEAKPGTAPTPGEAVGSLDAKQPEPGEQPEASPPAPAASAQSEGSAGDSERAQGTQYAGGSGPTPELTQHPELAGALERQRRVREGDSPAHLFEAIRRAEGEAPREPEGKPW